MMIKRYIFLILKVCKKEKSNLCYDAFIFETENSEILISAENFSLNIKSFTLKSEEVHKISICNHDRSLENSYIWKR